MKKDIVKIIERIGFSDKAAKVYLSALELGEATVQSLAKRSEVKRTSIYYVLEELKTSGAIVPTRRNKRLYYIPVPPKEVLTLARERMYEFENSIPEIEAFQHKAFPKPRLYFLYGPQGFKHIWEMIFSSHEKDFRIITEGSNFLDFVREKYIIDDIIKTKRKLGIKSRQLIVDSPYARTIVAKDFVEGRESKILPPRTKLPFTEVISEHFVAFISPRWDDTLFVVENESFVTTRKSNFDLLWSLLPKIDTNKETK